MHKPRSRILFSKRIILLSLVFWLTPYPPSAASESVSVELTPYVEGLEQPVGIAHAGDRRLFVLERAGRIRVIDADGGLLATPFLDIRERVEAGGGEQGLLGLAFHPRYRDTGHFYVYYTHTPAGRTTRSRVARFQVDGSDANRADRDSEQIVLEFEQPFVNHNGGDLHFGPDGYLYIASGDGGSAGDPRNNAQNMGVLLGKLLRIDIDIDTDLPAPGPDCDLSGASNYRIPPGNAFDDGSGGGCDEIYASGLRNPWRFSFDRATGDLWIGDVGQGSAEEIDRIPADAAGGLNFGWRCFEGTLPFDTVGCQANYLPPVHDYSHAAGACSVTGGFVYRGLRYPALVGQYFFTDFCDAAIRTLSPVDGIFQPGEALGPGSIDTPTAFGEDLFGELYLASLDGEIMRLRGVDDPEPAPMIRNVSYNGFIPADGIRMGFIVGRRTSLAISAERLPGEVRTALPDPMLRLTTLTGAELNANDDCDLDNLDSFIGREVNAVSDACIVATLDPGAYIVAVADASATGGNALVSATTPDDAPATLRNVSYNGLVEAAGIRPGLIIARRSTYVITAERAGSGAGVADPFLRLRTLDGIELEANDDCTAVELERHLGRVLATAQDACLITVLDPGAYVVEVEDARGGGTILFSVIESIIGSP